jgi:hypothetical protein
MTSRGAYALPPATGIVLTHFLTVADVARSADFYARVLGGQIVRGGAPTVVQLANSWVILNVGGGPTDDKPTVILHTPTNPDEAAVVALLDTIQGISRATAQVVVAEIGTDMTCFPSAAALAAWAGLAPGNDERARQQRSGRTR